MVHAAIIPNDDLIELPLVCVDRTFGLFDVVEKLFEQGIARGAIPPTIFACHQAAEKTGIFCRYQDEFAQEGVWHLRECRRSHRFANAGAPGVIDVVDSQTASRSCSEGGKASHAAPCSRIFVSPPVDGILRE